MHLMKLGSRLKNKIEFQSRPTWRPGNSAVSHMKNDGLLSQQGARRRLDMHRQTGFFATWDFVGFVGQFTSLQPSVPQAVGRWYQSWLESVEAKLSSLRGGKYDHY